MNNEYKVNFFYVKMGTDNGLKNQNLPCNIITNKNLDEIVHILDNNAILLSFNVN